MTWVDYIVLLIAIGAGVRIVVIINKSDSEEKKTDPYHWLLGILLLCASWFLIGVIFPSFKNTKMKFGAGANQIEQKYEQKGNVNSDTIHIRIKPKKK